MSTARIRQTIRDAVRHYKQTYFHMPDLLLIPPNEYCAVISNMVFCDACAMDMKTGAIKFDGMTLLRYEGTDITVAHSGRTP